MVAALTLARDYGIIQFSLDGRPVGEPIDLYHYPEVLASGELALGTRMLTAGKQSGPKLTRDQDLRAHGPDIQFRRLGNWLKEHRVLNPDLGPADLGCLQAQ